MSEGQESELDALIAFASGDNRVCPEPKCWHNLWELLPGKQRIGAGYSPPAPLILAAWWETSDEEKRERFLLHLRYAAEHGMLPQIDRFVRSLSTEQWHYRRRH